MTPSERKRGLRSAVDARYRHQGGGLAVSKTEPEIMWGVIDSLVDEEARLRDCLGQIALACLESDTAEAYHWAYRAITKDFTGEADEQSDAMRAAIEKARSQRV